MEYRLAALHGRHPASGEGLAVPDLVDLVEDRDGWVAGAQKVGVERVDRSITAGPGADRSSGRDQGLGRHLPAEDPNSPVGGAEAPEEVHIQGFQVQVLDQFVEGRGHASILVARRYSPPPVR